MNERRRPSVPTSTPSDLGRRLREAEDTLGAIRAGEVDAVLVDGPKGQLVYTLESPDQPFRVFVEHMQEGALTIDASRTILYSNHHFAQMVDTPLEEVVGATLDRFIAPSSLLGFRTTITAAATLPSRGDHSLLTARSRVLPARLAVTALPSLYQPTYGVLITDLTERERAREFEAAHTRALEANAARDQFLAMVSHELRTPLHAILGWAQLLLGAAGLSAQLDKGLRVIERNARSQAQLIDDLLDVSRIIAGKLRLELQPLDWREVVESALASIRPAADAKSISLSVRTDPRVQTITGDPQRLQQVVWNLLSNAVKYTQNGGAVQVSYEKLDHQFEFRVVDNGRGIESSFLPSIFEIFSQQDSSSTRSAGGLGLGLSIVKHLVEMHGGRVDAESAGPNQGATFRVRLPLDAEAHPAVPTTSDHPRESEAPLLDGLSIVVLDDDPDARDMVAELLERTGAQVFVAGTVDEAHRILASHHADVLVSDLGLPGTDGYTFIRQVRAAGRSSRELPAVALTAFARNEDRRRALLAGFQVHVAKPVDGDELRAVVASLLGRTGG